MLTFTAISAARPAMIQQPHILKRLSNFSFFKRQPVDDLWILVAVIIVVWLMLGYRDVYDRLNRFLLYNNLSSRLQSWFSESKCFANFRMWIFAPFSSPLSLLELWSGAILWYRVLGPWGEVLVLIEPPSCIRSLQCLFPRRHLAFAHSQLILLRAQCLSLLAETVQEQA